MKEGLYKVTKKILLLAFVVLTVFIGLKTTTFAATSKVTNLKQVGAHETSVSVSWDAVLGASSYTVYISEGNTFPENATITKSAYTSSTSVYGLNPNRTYYIKVLVNGSNTFSDTLACVTTPESTSGLIHSSSTTSSVSVSWSAPISGADYYKIYYKPNSSSMAEIYAGSTTSRTYTIKNLIDDTSYSVYVYPAKKSASGYEAVGYGAHGYYIATVAKASKLSSVKLYRWDASTSAATVSFTNNSKNQSGVQIEICSLSGKKIKTLTASKYASNISFALSSIKNKGFKYRLRTYVTANSKNCYGPYTSQKIAIARPKVTATKKSNTSLKLSWKKISGAKSYTIYVAKEKNDKFKKVATVKTTSYTLKKTKYYHYYYIYVKANGVKSGKKTYSSTEAVYAPITQVYYYKYSGASNYYTTYSKQ